MSNTRQSDMSLTQLSIKKAETEESISKFIDQIQVNKLSMQMISQKLEVETQNFSDTRSTLTEEQNQYGVALIQNLKKGLRQQKIDLEGQEKFLSHLIDTQKKYDNMINARLCPPKPVQATSPVAPVDEKALKPLQDQLAIATQKQKDAFCKDIEKYITATYEIMALTKSIEALLPKEPRVVKPLKPFVPSEAKLNPTIASYYNQGLFPPSSDEALKWLPQVEREALKRK